MRRSARSVGWLVFSRPSSGCGLSLDLPLTERAAGRPAWLDRSLVTTSMKACPPAGPAQPPRGDQGGWISGWPGSWAPQGSVLGQRRRRELVRDPQRGADPPSVLGQHRSGPPGRLRVHRGLLQPPAPAVLTGLPDPGRVPTDPPSHRRGGGIIKLSVKPGQAHGLLQDFQLDQMSLVGGNGSRPRYQAGNDPTPSR